MIENKKTECNEVGTKMHSEDEQTVHTSIILQSILRGIAKTFETIQLLAGETKLNREELVKQTTLLKQILNTTDEEKDYVFTCAELLSEIRESVYQTEGHAAVVQSETNRIVNGLKTIHSKDDFVV